MDKNQDNNFVNKSSNEDEIDIMPILRTLLRGKNTLLESPL